MSTATRLTYQDYAALPDDGRRYELIDGELCEVTSPSRAHQRLLKRLFRLLDAAEARRLGEVFVAPFDVKLSESDVLEPDLLFVSRERASIVGSRFVAGGPDLIVEILSTSTRRRDLGIKADLYAKAGVREYWLGDPDVPSLAILVPGNGGWEPVQPDAGKIASTVIPDLVLDLPTLLADLG
jgi:Uma2 family endonuclease